MSLGFDVSKIDEEIPKGSPKREDLRIRDPDIVDWEAIVEVRGYSKSGGTTADLSRLARFAHYYEVETDKPPNKSIYMVNGQIYLPPTQRQAPLISSPEDVHEFGEQGGVIIWTLDLFQVLKTLSDKDLLDIRRSFREVTARWP
jgi:hypothetical protein